MDAERKRDRKRKLIVFGALTLVGCATTFGATVIAICDGIRGRSGTGLSVSDVTNWVFLLPGNVIFLLADFTQTQQLLANCCATPVFLLLNAVCYAAFWYGCWRAFAWLFRRRKLDSDDERERPWQRPEPRNPWG